MSKVTRAEDLVLPPADEFGNRWFSLRTDKEAPAILRSSIDGRYLVRMDGHYGFARVTTPEGVKLLKLSDVEEALKALNTWRRGRRRNAR